MSQLRNAAWQLNDSAELRVTWDNAELGRLERSPDGPIVRDLVRRGTRVQEAARRQVRLGHIGTGRSNLRYTIVKRLVWEGGPAARGGAGPASGMPVMLVGSEAPHALLHHEGSRPHEILPRRKKALAFYADSGRGPFVITRRVWHPGFSGNRYLSDNIHLAVQ